MNKSRLEAFSDGVLAIIITIMVLELQVPHGTAGWDALRPLLPRFLSYLLSFVYLGIYWNNHHHLFQVARHVDGVVLWANLHLLFWLSLFPFVTGWIGENPISTATTAAYGSILLMAALAYFLLVRALLHRHGKDSDLSRAIGRDFKGVVSVVLYVMGIACAFVWPVISILIYVGVGAMWMIPDRRMERVLS